MKKRVFAFALALCLCLTLLPASALAAETASTPDGTALTQSNISDFMTLSSYDTSGIYYLSENITLESTLTVTGMVTLDLNGKVLMLNSSIYDGTATGSVIKVSGNAELTLIDSGATATHYFYSQTGSVLWRWDKAAEGNASQPADADGKTYHTVTGGVITGGQTPYGGGIHLQGKSGLPAGNNTLTMNGGNIIGCTSVCGGGVFVGDGIVSGHPTVCGSFTMNGGSIAGCAASSQGGGVFVYGNSFFTMNGGSIHDCVCSNKTETGAQCFGAGVYNAGSFTMAGGSIENCRMEVSASDASTAGGGVYDCGTFTLAGGSITDCLAKGYGNNIFLKDKKLADVVDGAYVLVSSNGREFPLVINTCNINVTLKTHTCSFTQTGTTWSCSCGRSFTSAQEPIPYLDEMGVTRFCTKYDEVKIPQDTGHPKDFNLNKYYSADGNTSWFVATENVEVEQLSAYENVHLILCDGVTLTATQGLNGGDKTGVLTIYGQKAGTGKLVVSGGNKNSVGLYGIWCSSLTVNGGILEATGGDVTESEDCNTYGIYCNDTLIVNDGKITAKGGNIPNNATRDSYGIRVGNRDTRYAYAYINGGEITATGGNISGDKGTEGSSPGYSYGLYVSGQYLSLVNVTGGKLTAIGGSINAIHDPGENMVQSGSGGLQTAALQIEGGTIVAKSGNVHVKKGNSKSSDDNVSSVAMYAYYMDLSGGTVELTHGTAELEYSASSVVADTDAEMENDLLTGYLGYSGGTMKLKESELYSVCALSNKVTLADLLAEGYAYWQPDDEDGTTGQFVKLSELTDGALGHSYVKLCTHSATTGTCEYCGKNLDGEEPEDETGANNDLAWLLPVLGALDGEPFDDVKSGDWFYDDVHYVNEYGLMTGTGYRIFSPDASVTRGMVMTILARREGIKTDRYSPWYAAGVEWAVANGISDGTNPEAEITREELATMLYRYAKLKGYDLSGTTLASFSDANSVSSYAVSAMQWAVGSGLMNGSNGRLTPRDTATRAQLAAILHRFFG